MTENSEPQPASKPDSGKPLRGCLVIVGSVIALAAACVAFTGHSSGSGDQSGYVKVACREWVKDRLKAPTTAGFSGEVATSDGSRWTVTGNVDAANSFGAKTRSTYECVATHSGESTSLVSLDVE